MEYSEVVVRNWKKYLEHGDIKKIALLNKVDRDRVSDAIKNQQGSLETMQMIDAFIENKKSILAQIKSNAKTE